jgi:hypothetical protein
MDDDHPIILESNFKYDELEMLKEKHQDVLFLSFFLTGQVDQLYHRYLERQKTRHIAHKSTGEIPYDIFKASMFPYESLKCLGESIYYDTTTNLDVFQLIKEKTKAFISK